MENSQQQILSEIKDMISSIRAQIEQLDMKMAQLQNEVEPQTFDVEPIDISLDELPVEMVAAVGVADEIDDDLPFFEEKVEVPVAEKVMEMDEGPVEESVSEIDEEPMEERVVEQVEEPVEVPVEVQVELSVEEPVKVQVEASEAEPVKVQVEASEAEPVKASEQVKKQAVIDAMTARQAWRTDMPGAPVRDIRSAISLNDRVLFINRLFDEDPVSFQEALSAINQMSVLDDAVTYLVSAHPSWDLDSEIVYRFMMALRRKIN